jgi:hypothetical protein
MIRSRNDCIGFRLTVRIGKLSVARVSVSV